MKISGEASTITIGEKTIKVKNLKYRDLYTIVGDINDKMFNVIRRDAIEDDELLTTEMREFYINDTDGKVHTVCIMNDSADVNNVRITLDNDTTEVKNIEAFVAEYTENVMAERDTIAKIAFGYDDYLYEDCRKDIRDGIRMMRDQVEDRQEKLNK
jgi:hypothetical protein